VYDEVEIFQVKKFLHNYRRLCQLVSDEVREVFGFEWQSDALADLLDRGRQSAESFYISDEYSEELREARWARWDDRSFPGRTALLTRATRRAGFTPKPGQIVDSVAAMFVAVATSLEIGYVLPMSRKLPHDGVVFAELKPPGIAIEMNIAWRRGAANDNRLQELANALGR
jgi:DNA-binding transcriptional LysR family regulator